LTRSLVFLGVKGGPAIRPGSSMPTSILVEVAGSTILIDAGLGATRGVCDAGLALTEIDLIVITHLHSDHYLELGPLLHTAWTAGLTCPVPVIGPAGLSHYWEHFQAAMAFDVDLRVQDEGRVPFGPLADIREITEGEIWTGDGLSIHAIRNFHPPIEDSFALRLAADDRALVLSGDTAPFKGWVDFCKDCDLLVHEVMLPTGVDALMSRHRNPDHRLKEHILRSHTEAAEVGRIATAARAKALALNHFVPDGLPGFGPDDFHSAVRTTYAGPVTIGQDGLRLNW
jgi:ribonuclease BN (tRNA processing enzyme)